MREIVIDKREVYTEYREIGIKTFKIEKTQSSKLDYCLLVNIYRYIESI